MSVDLDNWTARKRAMVDEAYVDAMEKLRVSMTTYTQDMIDTNAVRGRGILLQPQRNKILSYDPSLHDCWLQFANALRECGDDCIEYFDVQHIELTEEILSMLVPALKSKHLNDLTLSLKSDIVDHGLRFASELLKSNLTIEGFDLENVSINGSSIEEKTTLIHLAKSVGDHPRLERLSLSQCGVGADTYSVASIVAASKNLTDLYLGGNEIGPEDARLISQFLATNPRMKCIYLGRNKLNDDSAMQLAQALKKNTNLRELWLNHNDISIIGKRALLKAFYDDTSLEAISESNHTCYMEIGYDSGPAESLLMEVMRIHRSNSPESSRKQKIYWASSVARNGFLNLQHFDDISPQLMPNILFLLQQDPEDVQNCLTKMFEIMHGWKMPLLYTPYALGSK